MGVAWKAGCTVTWFHGNKLLCCQSEGVGSGLRKESLALCKGLPVYSPPLQVELNQTSVVASSKSCLIRKCGRNYVFKLTQARP